MLILIVDDEPAHAEAIARSFAVSPQTYRVELVGSLDGYCKFIAAQTPDLAIVDLCLPDGRAESVLHCPPQDGAFPVIVMTSHGDEHAAVAAIQAGAMDYIVKSPATFADMPHTVARVIRSWMHLMEHQAAQSALKRSEENLRLASEAAQIGYWDHDLKHGRLAWSPVMEKMMGFEPGTFPGTFDTYLTLLHPGSLPVISAARKKAIEGDGLYQAELHFVLRDGSERWGLARGRVTRDSFGNPIRLMGVNVDITDRVRTEEKVCEIQARYRAILDTIPDPVWLKDTEGRFLAVNKAWLDCIGVSESQAVGRMDVEVFPEATVRLLRESDRQVLENAVPWRGEENMQNQKGQYVFDTRKTPLYDGYGRISGVVGIARNITEQKMVQAALRESEQRLRDIVFTSADWVWEVDAEGRYTYASEQVKQLLGYEPHEILGKTPFDFMPPEIAVQVRAVFEDIVRRKVSFSELENANLHRDGTLRYLVSSGVPLLDKSGNLAGFRGADKDVTEKKSLEEQVRQTQKLESIGQLAGGIAHDFNNILAAVMMHVSIIQRNDSLDAEAQSSLEDLLGAVRRAANLTRQLLMYSRRSVMEVEQLDLNELVSNFLKMLGRLIGEHITVRFDRREVATTIDADAGMVEQVLMNLAVNARDAMLRGGLLSINVEPVLIAAEHIKKQVQSMPGRYICLTVADTGCGMSAATLKHIFEPFFTTKEVGKGTGLGLATVYGIVAQHKGWIEVESELGKGTVFKVYFPAGAIVQNEKPAAQQLSILCGHETILYVEDDDSLRRAVAQGLRLIGYTVLEAENGLQAVEAWKANESKVDLVFTDMVMPGSMTGAELVRQLRADRPGLPAIVSSGYHRESDGEHFSPPPGTVYLQKPYEFDVLSQLIRECVSLQKP